MEAVITKKQSRAVREISAVWALICREVTAAFKSPGMLIMSLAMPIIMMGMIGGNLTQNMAGGLGFNFGLFMLVGMMVNMLYTFTSNGVASLVDDHDNNFPRNSWLRPFRGMPSSSEKSSVHGCRRPQVCWVR